MAYEAGWAVDQADVRPGDWAELEGVASFCVLSWARFHGWPGVKGR